MVRNQIGWNNFLDHLGFFSPMFVYLISFLGAKSFLISCHDQHFAYIQFSASFIKIVIPIQY